MKLYNTPERKIVELDLKNNEPTAVYTCGPTVYDYPHIGNWYTFIRYDLMLRLLRANDYAPIWIMNITDVGHLVSDADEGEDKLEKGARREGKNAWEIAKFYGDYFLDGLKRLNFSDITKITKATDYIEAQIELVKKLEERGYTYKISDGIYYDTSKFKDYAEFAHLNIREQEAGGRIESNPDKKNPSDFALWKFSPEDQKRDMEWDSPWGKGFPGWHLECSAMIHAELGQPIDIHGGGIDHIQIHHTNEVAQSEAAYDAPLSRYWMHCNHILIDGKKMAKSEGNFLTLEDIEQRGISLDVFRLHVISSHYRSQSEVSWSLLESTRNRFQSWVDRATLRWQGQSEPLGDDSIEQIILDAMNEDLGSPNVLSIIDGITVFTDERVKFIDKLLGTKLEYYSRPLEDSEKALLSQRAAARAASDFNKSDELRESLKNQGIIVRDEADGQKWSRVV